MTIQKDMDMMTVLASMHYCGHANTLTQVVHRATLQNTTHLSDVPIKTNESALGFFIDSDNKASNTIFWHPTPVVLLVTGILFFQ